MSREISNLQDILDSRDIIARIRELESLRDEANSDEGREMQTMPDGEKIATNADFGEEEYEQLVQLQELEEQASGYADWEYGETLIRETYFEDYAQQVADDLCSSDTPHRWPFTCIDWEQAAEELKADYTAVEYGGVTYYIHG